MSQPSPPVSTTPFVPPWEQTSGWRRVWQTLLQWRQGLFLTALAATTWWLWSYVQQHSHYPAIALTRTHDVTAPEVGTFETLLVEKGTEVKKGQVLGKMDTRPHQVEASIAQAEKKRLEGLLVSTALQFRISQVALQARLQTFVHQAHTSLATGRTQLRTTKAELKALNKELRWLNKLRSRQLGRPNNLGALQARQKSLQALLQAMPGLLRVYRKKRSQAQHLSRGTPGLSGKASKEQMEKLLKPIQMEWAIQTLRIKKLSLLRERLTLRAPVAGIVQEILQRPGARLLQGAPVLRITRANKGAIMAYIDQVTARRIKIGQIVQVGLRFPEQSSVWDHFRTPPPLCAKVTHIGIIEPIPLRFRKVPQKPIWVRPVAIRLRKPFALIPGEMLIVDFQQGGCKP